MKVRVIRILEYEYPDEISYAIDRARWTHGVLNVGPGNHMSMKSAVLPVDFLSEDGPVVPTEHNDETLPTD